MSSTRWAHYTLCLLYMMECTCVTTARVKSNRAYFEKFHRTGLWVVREQSFRVGVGRFPTHSSLRKLRSQSHMLNIVSPEPARSFSPSTGFLVIAETSPQSDHFKWEPTPRSGRYRFFQRHLGVGKFSKRVLDLRPLSARFSKNI